MLPFLRIGINNFALFLSLQVRVIWFSKSDHQKCKLFYNVSCNELYCVWYFKTSVNENSLLFVIYKSKKKKQTFNKTYGGKAAIGT